MSSNSPRVPRCGAGRTDAAPRFGAPQAFTAVSFPVLGVTLHMTEMPVDDIFLLLGGCGALGAAAVVAVGGGRRRLGGLAAAVLRATAGK
ncbi:hypothetical protein [Streptomyces daghestanicus]|jgi:hypothetical protein|uniref:Uncharacterized protein n=1 Tax=Streptomyces daghestanicus TaxID=66885 RepID=A0ABQ3Q7C0_9ACTN|nr:hypothetical protein [Streptomyces daghestanicus]GGU70453.1 hypothetical protein GCM10010259_70080 [Streptomyces daghestanicus]GHI33154.1 hypothetical protein Sdagh_48840 [Streptomyces daghestanicus]